MSYQQHHQHRHKVYKNRFCGEIKYKCYVRSSAHVRHICVIWKSESFENRAYGKNPTRPTFYNITHRRSPYQTIITRTRNLVYFKGIRIVFFCCHRSAMLCWTQLAFLITAKLRQVSWVLLQPRLQVTVNCTQTFRLAWLSSADCLFRIQWVRCQHSSRICCSTTPVCSQYITS